MCDRERIEVVLADGQGVVRAGLLLSSVQSRTSKYSAKPAMARSRPALPEASSPRSGARFEPSRVDGVTVIREVPAADRRTRILVLTTCDGDQDISRASKAGARGYLLKVRTVGRSTRCRACCQSRTDSHPTDRGRPARVDHNSAPLTPRELEVLRQVAAGKANKEIAYELAVSEGTAKTYVAKTSRNSGARAEPRQWRSPPPRGMAALIGAVLDGARLFVG